MQKGLLKRLETASSSRERPADNSLDRKESRRFPAVQLDPEAFFEEGPKIPPLVEVREEGAAWSPERSSRPEGYDGSREQVASGRRSDPTDLTRRPPRRRTYGEDDRQPQAGGRQIYQHQRYFHRDVVYDSRYFTDEVSASRSRPQPVNEDLRQYRKRPYESEKHERYSDSEDEAFYDPQENRQHLEDHGPRQPRQEEFVEEANGNFAERNVPSAAHKEQDNDNGDGLHGLPQTKFCSDYDVRFSTTRPPLQAAIPEKYVPQEYDDSKWEKIGTIRPGPNFDLLCKGQIKVSFPPNSPSCAPAFTSFEESGLHPGILKNIQRRGFERPTPIQRQGIPILLSGRDLMGCAATGSGKTCSFVLPILHKLLCSDGKPRPTRPSLPYVLIVEPTRELAQQLHSEMCYFAKGLGIESLLLHGQVYDVAKRDLLRKGVHVVVGTVGKLTQWIRQNRLQLENLRLVVLDEADQMLEMGHFPELGEDILIPLKSRKLVRKNGELPREKKRLIYAREDYVFLSVGSVGGANVDVQQTILQVESQEEKRDLLFEVLRDLHDETNGDYKVLIFVNHRGKADFLAAILESQELIALSIHAELTPRMREVAMDLFRQDGMLKILVATDLCCRGLDIKDLDMVINFDMPRDVNHYVHRIGRTGRVGRRGKAISFFYVDTDRYIVRPLLAVLRDAEQDVPEWLLEMSTRCPPDAGWKSYKRDQRLQPMLPVAHQTLEREDW
ncbi:unnamed protein product [Cyprideis torosa]|uniref:RNA helicase n=1 Tax=Cyprideis torosa TaxID=163714 RepID=A0A7R8WCQ3_9CRUS|nr:unnamed protein product [Cyprideis torosa]CAG0891120.1 unnamed protein product [Cyprideis torosa]